MQSSELIITFPSPPEQACTCILLGAHKDNVGPKFFSDLCVWSEELSLYASPQAQESTQTICHVTKSSFPQSLGQESISVTGRATFTSRPLTHIFTALPPTQILFCLLSAHGSIRKRHQRCQAWIWFCSNTFVLFHSWKRPSHLWCHGVQAVCWP